MCECVCARACVRACVRVSVIYGFGERRFRVRIMAGGRVTSAAPPMALVEIYHLKSSSSSSCSSSCSFYSFSSFST